MIKQQLHGRITHAQERYNFPRKTYSGTVWCEMKKRIKTNINIFTSANDTTSLEYVANPSYYQPLCIYWSHWSLFWLLDKGNLNQGILSMPYILIQSIIIWCRGSFVSLNLYHYALKRVRPSLDLYLNIIKSEELGTPPPMMRGWR